LTRPKSARWHTIYSILSTIIEEGAIAAGFLWVLPLFGIIVPAWAVTVIMAAFAVFSYVMYRVGHPTISYKEVSAPESIIGNRGVVENPLNPEGYVKVNGELWRAVCPNAPVEKGEEVVVTNIEGLRLTVERKTGL
jgi:membrane protein implicated in regulation of membrane protease activity